MSVAFRILPALNRHQRRLRGRRAIARRIMGRGHSGTVVLRKIGLGVRVRLGNVRCRRIAAVGRIVQVHVLGWKSEEIDRKVVRRDRHRHPIRRAPGRIPLHGSMPARAGDGPGGHGRGWRSSGRAGRRCPGRACSIGNGRIGLARSSDGGSDARSTSRGSPAGRRGTRGNDTMSFASAHRTAAAQAGLTASHGAGPAGRPVGTASGTPPPHTGRGDRCDGWPRGV
jgi:hypothetical protein